MILHKPIELKVAVAVLMPTVLRVSITVVFSYRAKLLEHIGNLLQKQKFFTEFFFFFNQTNISVGSSPICDCQLENSTDLVICFQGVSLFT